MKRTLIKTAAILAFAFNLTVGLAQGYNYQITRVVDGDTVEIKVDWLPKELGDKIKIRIFGVDTPEKGGRAKCSAEAKMGEQATKFAVETIYNAESTTIVIKEWDKFGGRILGDVLVDGKSLRELLIKSGYARPYFGEAKKSWCD